jgi:hypothetical protein
VTVRGTGMGPRPRGDTPVLARIPPIVWAPLASAVALTVPIALALATHRLFLFASLGPTAVLLAHDPRHPSARTYAALVAHAGGFLAAAASVTVFGIARAPSVFVAGSVSPARAGAAVLALAIAIVLEVALHAEHPPAASTTLLVALGSFHPTLANAALVVGGVAAVLVLGTPMRWLRAGAERRAGLPDTSGATG